MKPLVKSRLLWALLAIVGGYLSVALRRYLPADLAALLSDELIGAVGAALGLGAVGLRVQDRRRVVTAGQMLDRKAAKAAAKLSAVLLCGCSTVTAAIAPEPVRCDTRARLECATEPATGVPVCSVYCRGAVVWRQACPSPMVRGGRLYCGELAVLALPGDVSAAR